MRALKLDEGLISELGSLQGADNNTLFEIPPNRISPGFRV